MFLYYIFVPGQPMAGLQSQALPSCWLAVLRAVTSLILLAQKLARAMIDRTALYTRITLRYRAIEQHNLS